MCFKTCVIHALHLLQRNNFLQISIFEFCVDLQFHFFMFEFRFDFFLDQPNSHLVVHVHIDISLRQVVICCS